MSIAQPSAFGRFKSEIKVEITHTHSHDSDEHSHDYADTESEDHHSEENPQSEHQHSHTHTLTLVASAAAVTLPTLPFINYISVQTDKKHLTANENPTAERFLDALFRPPIQA